MKRNSRNSVLFVSLVLVAAFALNACATGISAIKADYNSATTEEQEAQKKADLAAKKKVKVKQQLSGEYGKLSDSSMEAARRNEARAACAALAKAELSEPADPDAVQAAKAKMEELGVTCTADGNYEPIIGSKPAAADSKPAPKSEPAPADSKAAAPEAPAAEELPSEEPEAKAPPAPAPAPAPAEVPVAVVKVQECSAGKFWTKGTPSADYEVRHVKGTFYIVEKADETKFYQVACEAGKVFYFGATKLLKTEPVK